MISQTFPSYNPYPCKKSALLPSNGDSEERPSPGAPNAMLIKVLGYLPPPVICRSAASPEHLKTTVGDENMNPMLPSGSRQITSPSDVSPTTPRATRAKRRRAVYSPECSPKRVRTGTTSSVPSTQNDPTKSRSSSTSCMNSILQGVFAVKGFSEELTDFMSKMLLKDRTAVDYMPLLVSLSRLNENPLFLNATAYFDDVQKCVRTISPRFENSNQDAHEFIVELFSQIQAEYEGTIEAVNERRSEYGPDPVTRFFGHMLRRRYICKNKTCRNETVVEEKHTCFTVPIEEERFNSEESFGITDILKEVLIEETVNHTCEVCNGKKAVMKTEIMKLPENLIFVIERHEPEAELNESGPVAKMVLEKTLAFACDDEADELAIRGTERHSPCKRPHHPHKTFRLMVDDVKATLMADFIGFRNYCNDDDDLPEEDELTPISTLHDSERIDEAFVSFVRNVTQEVDAAEKVLNDLIRAHLLEHKEAYAPLTGRNIKGFTEYIRRSKRGGALATSLQFYACSNIFKTIFVIQEDDTFFKFIPVVPMPFQKEIYLLDKSLNYFSRGTPPPDTEYSLNAVVSYLGGNTNGHYRCAIQRTPEKWFEYKDGAVKSVKERYALSNTASVVIYSNTDNREECGTDSDYTDPDDSDFD